MKIEIEVKRRRMSVTQGAADVYINGREVASFEDDIRMIPKGERYFGEKVGDWASVSPDTQFVLLALYHPYDGIYHYSAAMKAALYDILKQEQNGVETHESNGRCQKNRRSRPGHNPEKHPKCQRMGGGHPDGTLCDRRTGDLTEVPVRDC